MSHRVLLEIGVASVDDALAAVANGADRLEVSSALSLGGLTPSAGLFAAVRRQVRVPLIAMVRPRSGGFCYSATDFDVMLHDANSLLSAGADGLAFGILTAEGEIDVPRSRMIRKECSTRAAVFHRAFDVTPDPFAALEVLIDLGFTRVMTSGQEASAPRGGELIAAMIRQSAGRIEILPAGGIKAETVGDLLARTGANQIHAGARTSGCDGSVSLHPEVRFGASTMLPEDRFDRIDPDAVSALRSKLSGITCNR